MPEAQDLKPGCGVVHMQTKPDEPYCGGQGPAYYLDRRPDKSFWCSSCVGVWEQQGFDPASDADQVEPRRWPAPGLVQGSGKEPVDDTFRGEDGEVLCPIVLTVSNRFKVRGAKEMCVTDSTEVVQVKKFKTDTVRIFRKYGVTIKLGDFESARIDVGIEVPCYLADAARADIWAQHFVEKRLTEEVTTVRSHGEGDDDDPL